MRSASKTPSPRKYQEPEEVVRKTTAINISILTKKLTPHNLFHGLQESRNINRVIY